MAVSSDVEVALCLAIRAAPVVGIAAAFMAASSKPFPSLPNSLDLARVGESFAFRRWRWWPRRWKTVVSHMFVHASAEHLLSNVLALSAVTVDFRVNFFRSAVRERVYRVRDAVQDTILSSAVMLLGGVFGGLPGHALYCEYKRRQSKQAYGFGMPVVEALVGHVHRLAADRVYVCGVSAANAALCGFNATCYGRFSGAAMTAVDIAAGLYADRTPSLFIAVPGAEPAVGHAAHAGGLLVGALMGWLWRRFVVSRRRMGGRQDDVR